MDREALIEVILQGVLSKLAELDEPSVSKLNIDSQTGEGSQPLSCEKSKKILVISAEKEKGCEFLKVGSQLENAYQLVSAADSQYEICPRSFDLVVISGATNTDVAKLSAGIFDQPHLKLISNAIMAGKKIVLTTDNIEYLKYTKEEPAAFRTFFNSKLDVLKRWGMEIVTEAQLEAKLISEIKCQEETQKIVGLDLRKPVITEKDVRCASESGYREITIGRKSIVSDLAKEFAKANKITFLRSGEGR